MAYSNRNNSYNKKDQPKAKLPEGYLDGGYYLDGNDKKKINPKYIVEFPKAIANALSSEGGNANKRTQIRKYYDFALRVFERAQQSNVEFSEIQPEILRLIPHVTYAKERNVVSDLFVQFITKNVNAIHDKKDFQAFIKHFESVVAFTKKG